MNRLLITGRNSELARDSFQRTASPRLPGSSYDQTTGEAVSYSRSTPESAAGGPRIIVTATAPKDAGWPLARRPTAPPKQASAIAWLLDSGEFDTCEIAETLGITEAEVANTLHRVREERRARG